MQRDEPTLDDTFLAAWPATEDLSEGVSFQPVPRYLRYPKLDRSTGTEGNIACAHRVIAEGDVRFSPAGRELARLVVGETVYVTREHLSNDGRKWVFFRVLRDDGTIEHEGWTAMTKKNGTPKLQPM